MRKLIAGLGLFGGLLAPAAGFAQEAVDTEEFQEEPEEVVVYGDRFARWDGTRWHAVTQIGFPVPYTIDMKRNYSSRFQSLEVDMVLACEKTFRRSRKRMEVDCRIEDIAIVGIPYLTNNEHTTDVLLEMDQALTDATIQLHVTDDGRIVNIDLENTGLADIRRQRLIQETYRVLLSRVVSGFHMRLPPSNQLNEGQWVEYDASLFELPLSVSADGNTMSSSGMNGSGGAATAVQNSRAGSFVVHQLDRYKGNLVVQSVGEAAIAQGGSEEDTNFFKVKLDGVAIYDKTSGIMTERVWSLQGRATASSQLEDGWGGTRYFTFGRIRQLGLEDKIELGPTSRAVPPGTRHSEYPTWKGIQ